MSEWPGWVRRSAFGAVGRRRWSSWPRWSAGRSPSGGRCRRSTARCGSPGLADEVQVLRDEHGIPQVYADNSADLFYAQGFVQAQDRFFEMDFRRHVTAGRISELLGEKTVETDMFIRTMGWREVAAREYDLLAARHPRLPRRLQRRRERLPRRQAAPPSCPLEYTVLGLGGLRLPAREVDAGRLAGLAQGDGVGPRAATWTRRSRAPGCRSAARPEQVDELYPRYPYDRHAPIVPTTGRRARRARPRVRRWGRRRCTRWRPYAAASTPSPT